MSRNSRLREMRAEWDKMFELNVPKVRIIPPEERRGDPYNGKVDPVAPMSREAVDSGVDTSRTAPESGGLDSGKTSEPQTRLTLPTTVAQIPVTQKQASQAKGTENANGAVKAEVFEMPRPPSISPIDLQRIARGDTAERNLETPRQDLPLDSTTSRQQDKESGPIPVAQKLTSQAKGAEKAKGFEMPRPPSISPIDLQRVARGDAAERNLQTPRQDLPRSLDIMTSRQPDKEAVPTTARIGSPRQLPLSKSVTAQQLQGTVLEPLETARQEPLIPQIHNGHSNVKDDGDENDINNQTQKREPRFTLASKEKLSLRQGTLVTAVMSQLKGLQSSIAARKARELGSMDMIKTYVMGGSYFLKLEPDGSSTPCLVGIGGKDAVTFWWEKRKADITAIPLGELIRIEYGIESNCFRSLQRSKLGEFQNVLPWNCFTVVFRNQSVDFFADRREVCRVRTDAQTGKRSLVTNYSLEAIQHESPLTPSIERLAEIDDSVEKFLYGFAVVFRKERYERGSIKTLAEIPGMMNCMTHVRLRRAVIKLDYVSTAVWEIRMKQTPAVSQLPLPTERDDSTPPTKRSSISQRVIEILEPTPRICNTPASPGNYLLEAKARLRCWKVPEEALGPNVLRQLKGLHKTLEVRKIKEQGLYSLVDRQVLGGTYLLKVEEEVISGSSRPKIVPCLVGIGGEESVTFWWEFVGGNVVTIPLDKVLAVEYGVTSKCYKLLQKARTGDMLNVLPWNCFTVRFTENRFVHFCADRRRRAFVKIDKNGKRSLVSNRATDTFKKDPIIIESAGRLSEVDDDIEKFLFGFAVCFRQERSQRPHMRFVGHVPGLPMSFNQLRLRRAVIKMEYVQNLTAEALADLLN